MRLQWAFPTVQVWALPALDFGGTELWEVDIAENAGILLQAPWSTSRWPECVGTQRAPMWCCSQLQHPQPSGTTGLCLCFIPAPEDPLSCGLVSHWGMIHFKESFLSLWKKHPCKAEGLHYPGQCRTNSGKDKEGFLEDGTKDELVWPEQGLGRPFHKINATYFPLLDFLVPYFSFTVSQKRPEY